MTFEDASWLIIEPAITALHQSFYFIPLMQIILEITLEVH